jgi:sialate O-acetylesterase
MIYNILKYKKHIALFIGGVCFSVLSYADVKLPKIFGSGMVLQRETNIKIWGWADKGEKVSVTLKKQRKAVTTGKDGKWQVLLKPEIAGGPYQLAIKGKNTIVLDDVLIGDVWVCSGQSNMEFAVSNAENAQEEINNANYPEIRHFEVPKAMSYNPKQDLERTAKWQQANSENVGKFTAVGYFYARELQKELDIPIGLIHTSWGGTDIETWMSRTALENGELFSEGNKIEKKQVNLNELIKQRKAQIVKKLKDVQGGFPDASTVVQWKNSEFDDTKWPSMKIPGLWEQSVENFDGIVWLRKTITVSAEDAGKPALLELARIDDSDETYFNGVKVGGMTDKYNDKRIYPVSGELLKEGKNVIAIKIEDNGGGGGIYGSPEEVKLSIGSKVISLASEWKYQVEKVFENSSTNTGNVGNPNDYPTLLFNAMIHPLTFLPIRGVIWYQGENNANRSYQYRTTFPLMINDWRSYWKQGDFPFYFVQLASWKASNGNSNNGSAWAELREAQNMTLATSNTGMAVTIDIGDRNDIHPRNKQDVGKRLAAVALNKTYGKGNEFSGPILDTMFNEGNKLILSFNHAENGLMVKNKYGYVMGFEVSSADKKFYYAKAHVQDHNKIVVYHENVGKPVSVRYAWADDAGDANLVNTEGFPAVPFRTDNWTGITEKVKYNIK